ncbi:MAG: prolipoprotein diacylglyceryl transferase [Polyangia bacterium]
MGDCFFHEISPHFFRLGPAMIGWYVVMFALAIVFGTLLWQWQTRRPEYDRKTMNRVNLAGALAVVPGARLGHVLAYDFDYYMSQPEEILMIWRGGLASHGVLAAMMIVFLVASICSSKLSFLDLLDRFVPSATVGAICVRIGNFLNSEIMGKPTDLPWGVRFMYFDSGTECRHPVQLYEALLLAGVLAVVLLIELCWRDRRPVGLQSGVFGVLYFAGRIPIEILKEPQTTLDVETAFTMGQFLSLAPIVLGAYFLFRAARAKRAE